MITIDDIQKWAKPHEAAPSGKHLVISNDNYQASIVGGASGLYGDFVDDFEVAFIDTKNGTFVTRYFYPEADDDVIAYLPMEEMLKLLNSIFRKNFQVR